MNEVPAKSTPKKIYVRSSVCRLCDGANESRHFHYAFPRRFIMPVELR
mgnify:CR=1 FL=1